MAPSSGSASPLCVLYLELNELFPNDLCVYLSLPGVTRSLQPATTSTSFSYAHLLSLNKPLIFLHSFPYSFPIPIAVSINTRLHPQVPQACRSEETRLSCVGWALSLSFSLLTLTLLLGKYLPKYQTTPPLLWVSPSSFSRLVRSSPGRCRSILRFA